MATILAISTETVLFILAIYGAVLSTFNLIKAIRKDRRSVKVTQGTKMPVSTDWQLGNTWTHVEVTNVGQRPVTITMIALELPNGHRMFAMERAKMPGMEDTPLPATLADGQTARMHQSYVDIGRGLLREGIKRTKLTPVCEDSAGNTYRGPRWKIDAEELAGM